MTATTACIKRRRFNPRSHEGSDEQDRETVLFLCGFNPRSHEGSDAIASRFIELTEVSIHAPTKGATQRITKTHLKFWSFNPRSHEGSDRVINRLQIRNQKFQSTLPRRERRTVKGFVNGVISVSIHAPTKGATEFTVEFLVTKAVSIHAPTKGATPSARPPSSHWPVSIHAPTKGATMSIQTYRRPHQDVSIHAPTKGATSTD